MRKVLILGATGMLGHTLFTSLHGSDGLTTFGVVRGNHERMVTLFGEKETARIITDIDVLDQNALTAAIAAIAPDVVINCIGLIKQSPLGKEPIPNIEINALLPHRLSLICRSAGIRVIHISTDCVFTGAKGGYREEDPTDATDLYGRTKALGELVDSEGAITLRTSIIGHELESAYGLLEWFLAQEGSVRGFTRAIFSGFPTIVLASIIRDHVLPNESLFGLYQVAAPPVGKRDLLEIIATRYRKQITIEPYDEFVIDRSLDGSRFSAATGYISPPWELLIDQMANHFEQSDIYAHKRRGTSL